MHQIVFQKKQLSLLIVIGCLLIIGNVIGQFNHYHFVGIQVDNDVYFDLDQYYSSGNFLHFGKGTPIKDNASKLTHWTFGQQISTPSISLYKPEKGDYPYNGWLFIRRQSINFKNKRSGSGWSFLLGVTGADLSLARPIHNFFHQVIRGIEKHSWTDPIPTFFHLNGSRFWFRSIDLGSHWKIQGKSIIDIGSYRIGSQINLGIHFGNLSFNPYQWIQPKNHEFRFSIHIQGKFRFRFTEYGLNGKILPFKSGGDWHLISQHFTFEYGVSMALETWKLFAIGAIATRDIQQQNESNHYFLQLGIIKTFL
ncbi:MAG: DUF2219 family protein [Flavobacteriaceae bacterium]|nr:DUF2219 family protein [Flavobacteriaceae bacterium]MCY4267813.1 DUF2219 family protein [Flavobacteriaceae bacterium]